MQDMWNICPVLYADPRVSSSFQPIICSFRFFVAQRYHHQYLLPRVHHPVVISILVEMAAACFNHILTKFTLHDVETKNSSQPPLKRKPILDAETMAKSSKGRHFSITEGSVWGSKTRQIFPRSIVEASRSQRTKSFPRLVMLATMQMSEFLEWQMGSRGNSQCGKRQWDCRSGQQKCHNPDHYNARHYGYSPNILQNRHKPRLDQFCAA